MHLALFVFVFIPLFLTGFVFLQFSGNIS